MAQMEIGVSVFPLSPPSFWGASISQGPPHSEDSELLAEESAGGGAARPARKDPGNQAAWALGMKSLALTLSCRPKAALRGQAGPLRRCHGGHWLPLGPSLAASMSASSQQLGAELSQPPPALS